MKASLALLLLGLACSQATIAPSNPFGEMSEDAEIVYLANSAQSMLGATYNFSTTLPGPETVETIDAGDLGRLTLLPGPPGIDSSYALLEIGPCAMILPHTHPIGNEVEYTLVGDNLWGGVVPEGKSKMEVKAIPPGTLSIYAQGLMHVQYNLGCERAKLFVTFDKPFPTGLVSVSSGVVSMPAFMAASSLNAYGSNLTAADIEEMQAYRATKDAGALTFAALPADECLKCEPAESKSDKP